MTSSKDDRAKDDPRREADAASRRDSSVAGYAEAYREHSDARSKELGRRSAAWRLKVAASIDELRAGSLEGSLDDAELTRRWVLDRLRSEATNSNNSAGERIRALELLGKATGAFAVEEGTPTPTSPDARASDERHGRTRPKGPKRSGGPQGW